MSVKMTEQVSEKSTANTTTVDLDSSLLTRIQNYAFGTKHANAEPGVLSTEDLIYQLRSNIARLDDESSRLDFMMDEVSTLIKRSIR